jgi:periplasmic protein TonB
MRARETRRSANGSARAGLPSLAAAGGAPFAYEYPMSKVLGLDAKTSTLRAWFGFTSGGTLLMVALMALASVVAWVHTMQERTAAAMPGEIEVMKEDPPPPPPPQAEPEAKAEPAPPPRMPHEAPPPPPAPAQAAKVLTREPDPNEPVDLTGNTIVTGNATDFPGGLTASNGTGANAVRSLTSPTGVPGGTGAPSAPPPPPGPDRSRPPSLAGGSDWNCPFPPEADTAQIDEAYVTVQVDVRPDGTPGAVTIVSDPGNGFGREARRCAMSKSFQAALDHDGNAIAGTKKVKVHFSR